ncbi:hypothetical protein G6F65_022554 [Rhizopus arrhizus]|nr:hypothetical protein G6F65_022554 [Rhizopus arrhizus]
MVPPSVVLPATPDTSEPLLLQRATGIDGGAAGVGIGTGQYQRAAARLGQATAAADSAAQQGVACNVGDQCAIVGDITGDRTAGTAVADLQRTARIDGGAAAVGRHCH